MWFDIQVQQICPSEEWGCFMSAIKENLPTVFRITGSKSEARALLGIVKGQFFKDCLLNPLQQDEDSESKDEQSEQRKPICLPW
jgi:tRNA (cytosine34-C5)-methyltransferase